MKKNFIVVFLLLSALTIYFACRKVDSRGNTTKPLTTDQIETKFFQNHQSTNPIIQRAMKYVKQQNDSFHFVQSIVSKVGYPYWDKALVYTGQQPKHRGNDGGDVDSIDVVYVPFVKDSDIYVNTALILKMGASSPVTTVVTAHQWLCDWQYSDLTTGPSTDTSRNQRDVFHLFADMDNSVFGRKTFHIIDSNLLSTADKATLDSMKLKFSDVTMNFTIGTEKDDSRHRTSYLQPLETCEYFTTCIEPCRAFRSASRGQEDPCTCITWQSWEICTIVWEDEGGSSGDPGGGGNGGGGGWIPPTCGGGVERGMRVNCDPGWSPPPGDGTLSYENKGYHHFDDWAISVEDYEKIETWRLNNVDTIGLDTCIQRVMNKILNSATPIGRMLCKMEEGIFKENSIDKFHLKFVVHSMGIDTLGHTTSGLYNQTTGVYTDTIQLNTSIVDSATEIGIAAVIIHETIHAYLNFILNKWFYSDYTATQISGMPFDTLFNKYIDSMLVINDRHGLNNWISHDPQKDHSYMADHFLAAFASALKTVDDSRNSDEYYWLLSWGGLWHSRTMKFYWPNFSAWGPSNPAPSNDSTWGLSYAFTQARLDSLRRYCSREYYDTSRAKGRKHIAGGCY